MTLQISIQNLRLNAAHDGFFRGKTEPSISVRAYGLQNGNLRDLGGVDADRFQTEDPPCDVVIDQTFEVAADDGDLVLILAIALEQDSGDDVDRVRNALRDPDALHFWSVDGEPEAWDAGEIEAQCDTWRAPRSVDLDYKKSAMSRSFDYDKWIGARAFVIGASKTTSDSSIGLVNDLVELRFVARKNDWTLQLEVRQV